MPRRKTQLLSDPHSNGRDLEMIKRALKEGWPIQKDMRKTAIDKIHNIISTSRDTRSIISAVQTLLMADRLNQADKHKLLDLLKIEKPQVINQFNFSDIKLSDEDISFMEKIIKKHFPKQIDTKQPEPEEPEIKKLNEAPDFKDE